MAAGAASLMEGMGKHPPLEQFEAWTEGTLPPGDCERFEHHLASCKPCLALLRREASVALALQESPPRRGGSARRLEAAVALVAAALGVLGWLKLGCA